MRSGRTIAGRFRIERFAASGGMGTVYKAMDRERGVPVAIKVVQAGAHADRFAREARAMAERLSVLVHPGIVGYVAHGATDAGEPYLVMDWIEGCALAQRIREGRLTVAEAIQVGLQLGRALAAMHGCGMVHRDIKPSNVMLAGGDLAQARIIDFGLVHLDTATIFTRAGVLLGTPGFIAPEQARGEPVDARADLYSLGAVLCACLTQRPPFIGTHYLAVLAKLMLEDAPRVSELGPEVPPALDTLIADLLAREADARPASADQVVARLADMIHDAPARDAAAARAISRGEQRFLSVLLMARTAQDALTTGELVALSQRQEADMARLHDGTVIAVFMAGDGPAQAAARAARCALASRAAGIVAPLVVATGRGQVDERMPVGEVIDRAFALLFDLEAMPLDTLDLSAPMPVAEDIAIDDVSARLLGSRFCIRHGAHGGHVLVGERAPAHAPPPDQEAAAAFVGRDRELAALVALLDECAREAAPRVALVTGPAGAGKSRLVHELTSGLLARSAPPAVWRAHGEPMRAGSSLGMLGQILADAMGWGPGASAAERQACIVRRVQARVPAESAERVAVFLGEMAEAPFAAEERELLREARRDARLMHDQMRQAWEDWLDAETRARPVILVLDDLHWGDLPTVRFIDAALRSLEGRPLCVLALARPEVHEVFPGLWSARGLEHIPLRPLSRHACMALARATGFAELGQAALDRLAERSGGNPFFLEELLRHAASGDGGAPPETVLAMIGARLQALPADERRALRAASVLGGRFWVGGVAALLGEPVGHAAALVERLAERELVSRGRGARLAGEIEYLFRHELARDAAHAMLTDEDRVRAHRCAGEWLEQAGERDAVVLAEHCWRGQELRRALPWFHRAAEQALEASDLQAAVERAERAIACGARGEVLGMLLLVQAEAHNWCIDPEAAFTCVDEALQHLAPESDAWIHAAHQAVWAASTLGRADEVVSLARAVCASAGQVPDEAHIVTLAWCAGNLVYLGRVVEARALRGWIDAHARPGPHSQAAVLCHMRAVFALEVDVDGRLDEAAAAFSQAVAHWETAGNQRQACMAGLNLGVVLRELGQYEQSIAALRATGERARRLGLDHLMTKYVIDLAIALARRGSLDEAAALIGATEARDIDPRWDMFLRVYRAQIALLGGLAADALAEMDRALAGNARHAVPRVCGFALAVRAQALLALGRAAEALADATEAVDMAAQAGGLEEGEALLRLVHARALRATGAHDQARAAIQAAAARLLALAAHIQEPAWRASFLDQVEEHRETLALARAWAVCA